MLLPVFYLIWRAAAGEGETGWPYLLSLRMAGLLGNTLLLTICVLAVVTGLAFPLAWLAGRAQMRGRGLMTWLGVLPLAMPGYLLAYTLLAAGGEYGTVSRLTDSAIRLPVPTGLWGSVIALSICNFPYLFLNLKAAVERLDPGLEEVGRTLGDGNRRIFLRIILPQLWPGYLAGALLVCMHVVGDFGVVSLMRYDALTSALYAEYADFSSGGISPTAGWLGLVLLGLSVAMLGADWAVLRKLRLEPGGRAKRQRRVWNPGAWAQAGGWTLTGLVIFLGLAMPLGTIIFWLRKIGVDDYVTPWWPTVKDALSVCMPAAILATLLALPIAWLNRRYGGAKGQILERLAYLGYAMPTVATGLGFVAMATWLDGKLGIDARSDWRLYQSMTLLIAAYSLHFLAEGIGPVRAALYVATPRLEEASRSLGRGKTATFIRVTLPLLRSGLAVSLALVFLSAMKELPLTFILSPIGFQTPATALWSATNEALYAAAAPHALTIMVISGLFVGLVLGKGRDRL